MALKSGGAKGCVITVIGSSNDLLSNSQPTNQPTNQPESPARVAQQTFLQPTNNQPNISRARALLGTWVRPLPPRAASRLSGLVRRLRCSSLNSIHAMCQADFGQGLGPHSKCPYNQSPITNHQNTQTNKQNKPILLPNSTPCNLFLSPPFIAGAYCMHGQVSRYVCSLVRT